MSFRQHLLAFTTFLGLTCLALYWPLLHINTHVGYNPIPDYYQFHWNFWWIRHALTTPGLNVFITDYVHYPAITNMSFNTLVPFWWPVWAVFEPWLGTLPAMNIVFVLGMSLSGYVFFVLLRAEGVPNRFALPFGAIYMLTSAMLLAVSLNNLNYISQFWFPLQILLWARVMRHGDNRRGIVWAGVLGLSFYGMMMTDYQHMLFLAFLLVPYGILTLVCARGWIARARLAGLGVFALALMTALLWFVGPLPHILTFDFAGTAPQPMEAAIGIDFPVGYFWRQYAYDRKVTLGALVLPLLVGGIIASLRARDGRRWFWFALLIVPLLVSAGPFIELAGRTLPTPYILLHQVFGGLFRVPSRFSVIILIPTLIFVGRALAGVRWLRGGWVGVGLMLLVLADARLFLPVPIKPLIPQYDFYRQIGAENDPGSFVVLEVPVAGGSGEAWVGEYRAMEAQMYGILHQQKMLNATISRVPLSHFWHWLYDDAMLAWLGQRRFLEPEIVEAQLRERVAEWPIGYVVVHQDVIGRSSHIPQEIIGYLNTLPDLLCPVFFEGDAVAYRATWHPSGCPPRTPPQAEPGLYRLDLGAPGDERFIGWGWHWPEPVGAVTWRWTGEYPQADLYVDLPPGQYGVTVHAQAFHEPRSLQLLLGDAPLGEPQIVGVGGLAPYTFDLPHGGDHLKLTLAYDATLVPRDVGLGGDERRLAVAVESVEFRRRARP